MKDFAENLNELITESGLSLRKLAELSGVTATQYSRYLGGATPTINITIKIADYFNRSLDYLFGLTESKHQCDFKSFEFNTSTFLANYERVLKANHTTNYQLAKDCRFNESIMRHWKSGRTPKLDVLYQIATHLTCSIDELLGIKKK